VTPASGTLPITVGKSTPQYVVPPFSSRLHLAAATTGHTPIMFDVSPYWGAPDVVSGSSTKGTASVDIAYPFASEWGMAPVEVGPFAAPATENYSTSGTLRTLGFDGSAAPSTGDLWYDVYGGSQGLNPLFLLPGQSGTMSVTYTVPSGTAGTTKSGTLYVETFDYNSITTGIGDWSSDVLGSVHYSYKLG
jgi:hypothetical protein